MDEDIKEFTSQRSGHAICHPLLTFRNAFRAPGCPSQHQSLRRSSFQVVAMERNCERVTCVATRPGPAHSLGSGQHAKCDEDPTRATCSMNQIVHTSAAASSPLATQALLMQKPKDHSITFCRRASSNSTAHQVLSAQKISHWRASTACSCPLNSEMRCSRSHDAIKSSRYSGQTQYPIQTSVQS